MRVAPIFTIACLAIQSSAAYGQRIISITAPDAEYPEAFSVISGVRPLRDGRVVVSDSKEKTVQLIDFAGTAKPIGRDGRGPGEWLLPNGLAALGGDTTALWDAGNRRFLRIAPDGRPTGDFRPATTNFGPMATLLPRGTDSRGNIYFQGSPFVTRNGEPAPAESVTVMRYDRARDRIDTVAFVHPAAGAAAVGATADGRASITNGLGNPLVPLDEWVALPDGRVAVVRGVDYRVDFYDNRAVKSSGPRVTYDRRPVDAAVKEAVTEQRRRQLTGASPRTRETGQASPIASDALKRFMNLEPWPAYLPPFLRGAAIARSAAHASQIWVLRAKANDAEPSRYDVFDDAGRVIARVQLPARTRLLAFAGQFAYAVRTDDDDLQYLQRYRLPAI